jgi:hypothetical protein
MSVLDTSTATTQSADGRQLMATEDRTAKAKDRAGVIDLIAQDPKTDEVVLVMSEPDEWDGSDQRLLALQERFNAYVSFLLDGEMAADHPEFGGKPARIEVRCAHMPDTRALELLGLIHDQLAFQEIELEVVIRGASIEKGYKVTTVTEAE